MGVNYTYDLVRTKRKNVAIHIKDGKITVRAPLKTALWKIEQFISSKQQWIEAKLADHTARRDKYSDVLDCKRFPFLGQDLAVVVTDKKTIKITDGRIFIPNTYLVQGQVGKSENFEKALRNAYRRSAKVYLGQRLDEVSQATNLNYTKFALTNATTKWGSCDSSNGIRLSWRLMLLDKDIIDYVIVHELAHTIEHNHSTKFWDLVYAILPQYKERRKCLKEMGMLITAW